MSSLGAIFNEAFNLGPRSSSRSSSIGGGGEGIAFGGLLPRTAVDWQGRVEAALASKQEAAADSRRRRLERRQLLLAAELARRSGQAPLQVPLFSPKERQRLERLRRLRSFVVLVAEDRASGEVVGSAAISLAQPEAALPPPFPTSKPRRAYVSNIAVSGAHRRRGVGTALLQRCERQARLWRQDSLWLHVELTNKAALKLYQRLGYTEVARDPTFTPNRRCLMRKEVPRCAAADEAPRQRRSGAMPGGAGGGGGSGSSNGSNGSSGRGGKGVYVWGEDLDS